MIRTNDILNAAEFGMYYGSFHDDNPPCCYDPTPDRSDIPSPEEGRDTQQSHSGAELTGIDKRVGDL
jgi:hypothetical protein